MFIKSLFLSFLFMFPAFAEDVFGEIDKNSFYTVDEIMSKYQYIHPTNCASEIFADALKDASDRITEDDADEEMLQIWAKNTILDAEVLKQVIKCPEVSGLSETETIIFSPVKYTFPWGQSVTVNYSTQPKVLKQKIALAERPSLPTDDPNPKLMDPNDPAKYVNTDPAWYAVMVVQHDSLKNFVGEGKNNLVSIKYINDNIGSIYPKGYWCTSRSAWANDKDTINQVVREVVDIENDSNDYYVAGDINLEWVMWAEVTADVVLTIATLGGGEFAMGAIRSLRATKTAVKAAKTMSELQKLEHIKPLAKMSGKLLQHSTKIERLGHNAENAKKYQTARKNWLAAKKAKNSADMAKYAREQEEILKAARKIDPKISKNALLEMDRVVAYNTAEQARLSEEIAKFMKEHKNQILATEKALKAAKAADSAEDIAKYEKELEELKQVDKYAENADALTDMMKFANEMKAFSRPQTGNIITRPFKKMKALYTTYKAVNSAKNAERLAKASKTVRAGLSTRSARFKDWLFHTSLKYGEKLVRFETKLGALTGAVYILGDMFDRTSTTSQKYSNGIEFKPFCLLSADDLEGDDNEVNYGMWLMWTGNSTLPADDDAAYLQVMDFVSKFSYTLNEFQDKHGAECNVDIYIVRPIIRLNESNPKKTEGELYYLFMNDIPWTTSDQFNSEHPDLEDWQRIQSDLEARNPKTEFQKRPEPGVVHETTETNDAE